MALCWWTIACQVVMIYLVVIIIVAIQVYLTYDMPKKQRQVQQADIQTGDVLGVSYRHLFGHLVTTWSGSIWHHTGVAWRCPSTNELYVFEAAIYGGNYRGVFRIPFDIWLKINRRMHICHLRLEGPIDTLELDNHFRSLEVIKLDSLNWQWYRFLQTRPYVDETPRTHYTCYEITIMLLQRMNIVRKELACSSYFARDVVHRKLPMEEGYSYSEAILLVQ